MKRVHLFSAFLAVTLLASSVGEAAAQPPAPEGPTTAAATPADVPEVFGSDAYAFDPLLYNGTIFWSATPTSCGAPGTEFPPPCQIRSRPANGGEARTLHDVGFTGPALASNIAADDQYVYWIGSDYQIKRLPRGATPATAPQPLGTTSSSPALQFEIAADANYLFWTESNSASGSRAGTLYRMPKAGGARELMRSDTQPMSDLRADGNGGAYYLVPLFGTSLLRTVPTATGFATDTTNLPSSVTAYTFDATTLYWAEKNTNLRLKRAPRNNPAAAVTIEDRGITGSPTAPVLAVDDTNLYWQETRSGSGPIYRRALATGPSAAITSNLFNARWMDSNGRHVFWSANDINRLPVNASTWMLDMTVAAEPIEVIQTVQRPANDVPLVSGKETFVRVYPRILLSTPERETIALFPGVELHGTRGGASLPGSPLQPETSFGRRTISATAPDRRVLDHGVWFRLPASWTDGTVSLRAVLNSRRVQQEINYANNETSRTISFNRKAPICLDVRPVATERGTTISSFSAGVSPFIRRAEHLLPTHNLRVFMRGGDPLRKPRWYLVESDPFGLSSSNADSGWMLFLLNVNTAFSSGLCTDGGPTIRTVMAQDFPGREVNGMQFGNSLLFFNFPTPAGEFAQNVPGGGVTLAHEIGHALGRGHINCGGPDGVDGGYPYDPCQLSNPGPNEHLGFDPRTRTLLLPESTGDLMSYAHLLPAPRPRWTSDYTWRGMFNALNNRSLAAVSTGTSAQNATSASRTSRTPSSGSGLIVTGFINGTTAELRESYVLGEPLLSQASAQLASTTAANASYRMRAFNGATVVYDEPLQTADVSDEASPFIPFFQRIDTTPVTRIDIIRVSDGARIGGVNASANAPTTTITAPVGGSINNRTLNITLDTSDVDGGPLHHMVRYSANDGATWTVVSSGLTGTNLALDMASLPGGATARVQVITTDGLNTAVATSAPFAVAKIGPEVSILPEPSMTFEQGTPVTLRGRAYDAEDGFLTGARVQWQVSGQVTASGDGEQFTLIDLPPGTYRVQHSASDLDGNRSDASVQLTIAPKHIRDVAAPTVDGHCDDASYEVDRDPITLRYADGTTAQVRMYRADGAVYACFGGLALGGDIADAATLRFDLDNSANATTQPGDLSFHIRRDGLIQSGQGNGTASESMDPVTSGVSGAISANGTSWSAEIRLDSARLGGWDRLVRLHAAHGNRATWPQASTADAPRSWGLTAFGTPPTPPAFRIQLPLVVR